MNSESLNTYISETASTIQKVTGIDLIYFLDINFQIIKEHKIKETTNCIQEIKNIIKSAAELEKINTPLDQKPFHTMTFLNENGLLIIVKLGNNEGLYLVIIAGENEPVDLISLLKICKELRVKYTNTLMASL